jgi:hypothetical protein
MYMNRSRILVLGGLLTAALVAPAMPARADRKEHIQHHENPGKHLGWDKTAGKKFDEHDRRYYRHPDPRFYHRDVRYDNWHQDRRYYGHPEPRFYRRDIRSDYRGHNRAEIHQDFKDVRDARKKVSDSRTELRKDYAELRKDRMELRRDLRNGASKDEIIKDRQELRSDMKEIYADRVDLRKNQSSLDSARRELGSDLRKR